MASPSCPFASPARCRLPVPGRHWLRRSRRRKVGRRLPVITG
ncbi:hypothetical protein [Variovorax sp. JS1663]|nr:hypothetical protein [Variovorax sp. JS1663]